MDEVVSKIAWTSIANLLHGLGFLDLEEFTTDVAVHADIPPDDFGLQSVDAAPGTAEPTPLMIGMDEHGLLVVQPIDFPASQDDIVAASRALHEDVTKYLAARVGATSVVANMQEVHFKAGCTSDDDLVEWLDEQLDGNQGFWFSEYEWVDDERKPNKGPGLEMTLGFHGSAARVSIDFPFDLESGLQLMRDIIDTLEADYWRKMDPGSEWFASGVFKRFPFLREQLPSREDWPQGLQGETARDAAKEWSRKRLHSILLELGPERGPALDLDLDEAVRDLALQVEEALATDDATQEGASDVSAPAEGLSPGIESIQAVTASSQNPPRWADLRPSQSPSARQDERQDSLWRSRTHAAPALLSAIMLFLALGAHPYGFYTSLRWIVFASALGVAYVLHEWHGTNVDEPVGREVGLVVFIGLAILFNPFVPVTLDRDTWAPMDYFGALVFALVAFGLKRPHSATLR